MKRLLRVLFLCFGLGIIGWLLFRMGLGEVWEQARHLGWAFPLVFLPYGFLFIFDVLGWSYTFPPNVLTKDVKLFQLYLVRLAGEAINNITPTAYLGGEPVKAAILKRYGVPMSEGLASVVVAKTVLALSQILFMFTGAVLLAFRLEDGRQAFGALLVAAPLAVLFAMGILVWQRKGLFEPLLKFREWTGLGPKSLEKWEEKFRNVDAKIRNFYQNYRGNFLKAIFFHLVAWVLGIFEVALILGLLGVDYTWREAFIIESLAQFAKGIGFIVPIPGSIGIQEGGGVLVFRILEMNPAAGLTLMLIKRVRELAYALLGVVLVSHLGTKVTPGAGPAAPVED